jgi:hypothetical protein
MTRKHQTSLKINMLITIRNNLYYIRAAQNGYINRALQAGIGETIKDTIATVMPSE